MCVSKANRQKLDLHGYFLAFAAVKAKPVSMPSCVSTLLWSALQPWYVADASLTSRSAASKYYPFNGHTFGWFPQGVHDGALAGWSAESWVGMSTRFPCTEYNEKVIMAELTWIQQRKPRQTVECARLPLSGVQSLFFHEVSVTPVGNGSSMPSQ